eukprot:294154_1
MPIKYPDFSGEWKLKATKNLNKYLKSEDENYLVRKRMRSISIKLIIEQKDNFVHKKINIGNGILEVEKKCNISDEYDYSSCDGKIIGTVKWDNADNIMKLIATEHVVNNPKRQYVSEMFFDVKNKKQLIW